MISVVGLLKIDESKPERVEYFFACLRSLEFLNPQFIIALDGPSKELAIKVLEYSEGKDFYFDRVNAPNYGGKYTELLGLCKYQFVCNFLEDHFCVMDEQREVADILQTMHDYGADVMKATFHKIEMNSVAAVSDKKHLSNGVLFHNDRKAHKEFQKYYGQRFYYGVNAVTTLDFAKRFWDRHFESRRPHNWELVNYTPELEHTVFIPAKEFLCSIDDPHGLPGSHLLARNDIKFWNLYESLQS